MDRLLVVDGSNLLFQMFFGMPARITGRDGRAIQGTLGFVGALLKIIRMVRPAYVAVLFDGEHENARRELDGDYKANRVDYSQVEDGENPFSQLPDIRSALDFLGICHAETQDCEADDWAAGYAHTYGKDMEVVIASQDSDYFQLITEKVRVVRYRGEKTVICGPEYIRAKLGIVPEQYADFKSLTGDTSDNIRGAYKIGPKTAAALLGQFGTLEGLLARADSIAKPSVRVSVLQSADRLRKNYRLIKLDGVETLPFELRQLQWQDKGMTTGQVLQGIGLR